MKSNFEFLNKYWETLAKIGETAESYLYNDPNACIYKLGMFAERLVQEIFANEGIDEPDYDNTHANRIKILKREGLIDRGGRIDDILYSLRMKRNDAVHKYEDSVDTAKSLLRMAFRLAVWFMEVYGDYNFQAPDFVMPENKPVPDYENIIKDFEEQLENGIRLDKEHYLRIFPVWFSFKGNIAVHLSTGKAAAICARVLKDKELKDIAEQQLFWVVGRNPFGQSMIYGEGSNYPQLYTALPGETVGEIPVGMQSYFNEDTPYWPQFNTATYKEVWGSSAARWLMLVSEF